MGNASYDSTVETLKRLARRNRTIHRETELNATHCNHALEGQTQ